MKIAENMNGGAEQERAERKRGREHTEFKKGTRLHGMK